MLSFEPFLVLAKIELGSKLSILLVYSIVFKPDDGSNPFEIMLNKKIYKRYGNCHSN